MLACTEFPKFWCPTPKLLRESVATCCCGFVSEVSASHHCIGLSGLLTLSVEICRKSWLHCRSSAQNMPKLSLWPLLLQIFFCSCTIWFLLFYIWGVGPTRQQRRCWRICSQSGLWPSCKSKFSVVKSQSSEHVFFFCSFLMCWLWVQNQISVLIRWGKLWPFHISSEWHVEIVPTPTGLDFPWHI